MRGGIATKSGLLHSDLYRLQANGSHIPCDSTAVPSQWKAMSDLSRSPASLRAMFLGILHQIHVFLLGPVLLRCPFLYLLSWMIKPPFTLVHLPDESIGLLMRYIGRAPLCCQSLFPVSAFLKTPVPRFVLQTITY